MGTGIFEQLHMLMTFEDTLTNMLEEPEDMQDLIDAICEYRLNYMKLIVEHLHPDVIVSHDDFGSKTSLFMSPNTWRELFKEPYRRLYSYLHENGVIVMHHGDSYLEPIVEDMAEIGIDIWQGVLPTNDIAAISEKVGDRMLLMGGIDSVIDREDATNVSLRDEMKWHTAFFAACRSIFNHPEGTPHPPEGRFHPVKDRISPVARQFSPSQRLDFIGAAALYRGSLFLTASRSCDMVTP